MSDQPPNPTCFECGANVLSGAAECTLCSSPVASSGPAAEAGQRGPIVLRLDAGGPVAGWQQHTGADVQVSAGPPAEMVVQLPPHDGPVSVFSSAAPFDDVEIGVTIRFARAQPEASAGVELRKSDMGNYVARLSPDGRFSVGAYSGPEWAGYLVPWTSHPAIRAGLGSRNRLRVSGKASQLRVFVNGVLVTSLRDERHPNGQWGVVGVAKAQPLEVAFSQIQLRDRG